MLSSTLDFILYYINLHICLSLICVIVFLLPKCHCVLSSVSNKHCYIILNYPRYCWWRSASIQLYNYTLLRYMTFASPLPMTICPTLVNATIGWADNNLWTEQRRARNKRNLNKIIWRQNTAIAPKVSLNGWQCSNDFRIPRCAGRLN